MALTLPWLVAAVVSALGEVAFTPKPRLIESVVARVVNDTASAMAARRGVRLTRPLDLRLVDRAQMRLARAAVDAAATPPESTSADWSRPSPEMLERALFTHLGLIAPPRPRAAGGPVSVSGPDESTGFYDPLHDLLLVANWEDLAAGQFALSRDVALALLDRRFDLTRWLTTRPPPARPLRPAPDHQTFDVQLARQAVAFGDANTQALERLDPGGLLPARRELSAILEQLRAEITSENGGARTASPSSAAATSPLALTRRLFVELDGTAFVAEMRARVPWAAVDDIWRRPPESTEHILHPLKYARAEEPDDLPPRLAAAFSGGAPRVLPGAVRSWSRYAPRPPPGYLPAGDDADWRIAHDDTLGELGVRQFLSGAVDAYRAERAATGWAGDRALLLHSAAVPASPSATFAAWIITWDDPSDADDFATMAARALATLAGLPGNAGADAGTDTTPNPVRPTAGRWRLTDGEGRLFALDHAVRAVGMVLAAPPAAEKLLGRLMAATTTTTPAPSARPRRPPQPSSAAGRAQIPARPR